MKKIDAMLLVLVPTIVAFCALTEFGYTPKYPAEITDLVEMCIEIGGQVTKYEDGISCSLEAKKD